MVRGLSHERLMDGFETNKDFAEFLQDVSDRIASDRFSWIGRRKLYLAFAPTSDWDDCVGDVELGDRIFELICSVYGVWR